MVSSHLDPTHRLRILAIELRAEIGAAWQPMEAARPVLSNESLADWLASDLVRRVGLVHCRASSVAAVLALMRIWYPSRGSFSIDKIRREVGKPEVKEALIKRSDLQGQMENSFPRLCEFLKVDATLFVAINTLKQYRNKRLAHRISEAISAETAEDRKASLQDFDLLLERSLDIFESLAMLFPELPLHDMRLEREKWQRDAKIYWQIVSVKLQN